MPNKSMLKLCGVSVKSVVRKSPVGISNKCPVSVIIVKGSNAGISADILNYQLCNKLKLIIAYLQTKTQDIY